MPTIIPFHLQQLEENSFHLFVEGTVNDIPCRILIDTGASKTVFDRAYLQAHKDAIQLTESEKLSSGLGTNTMKSEKAFIENLAIGSMQLGSYEGAVLDLTHVNNSYNTLGLQPVHAILGNDILCRYQAVIDYKRGVLELDLPSIDR
ncbi:MAG: retropepsin-like aspartic protease [Chitinophagales bacterium]|nr:retropepsin-like aspartic protease [Chitinophagales bacterium]